MSSDVESGPIFGRRNAERTDLHFVLRDSATLLEYDDLIVFRGTAEIDRCWAGDAVDTFVSFVLDGESTIRRSVVFRFSVTMSLMLYIFVYLLFINFDKSNIFCRKIIYLEEEFQPPFSQINILIIKLLVFSVHLISDHGSDLDGNGILGARNVAPEQRISITGRRRRKRSRIFTNCRQRGLTHCHAVRKGREFSDTRSVELNELRPLLQGRDFRWTGRSENRLEWDDERPRSHLHIAVSL